LYQTAKCIVCFGDEQEIFYIFCSCFVHKHKSILVCLSFQRTSGLLCFHILWRIIVNTCAIIWSCVVQNHWSNFVSEHLMIFSMFCHQIFVNACSEMNDIMKGKSKYSLCLYVFVMWCHGVTRLTNTRISQQWCVSSKGAAVKNVTWQRRLDRKDIFATICGPFPSIFATSVENKVGHVFDWLQTSWKYQDKQGLLCS